MSSIADCGLRIANWKKQGWTRCLNPKSEIQDPKLGGFTLLEVLIAVAIMSGIVTVIYSSFFTASRNIEQAEAIRDSSDMARTLMQKIANDVTNAYWKQAMSSPAIITIFNGKKVEVQTGDEKTRHDSVTLTTLTNSRKMNSKETELWEVGYFFKEKPKGSGYVMMRREKRELTKDVPAGEGGIEYEITDRIRSLQLRYSQMGGDTWLDEWNSTSRNGLPKFVEIAFTLESGMTYSTYVEIKNLKYL
jgi:general secretion pathway protein J